VPNISLASFIARASDSDREDFTMANVMFRNKTAGCNSFHMPRTYGSESNLTAVETLQGTTSWQNTLENSDGLYYTVKPKPSVWYVDR